MPLAQAGPRIEPPVSDPMVPSTITAATEAAEPAPLDPKAAFAAALAKKKAAGQARSAHLDGHGGVAGATASHKATRTFRRKSG